MSFSVKTVGIQFITLTTLSNWKQYQKSVGLIVTYGDQNADDIPNVSHFSGIGMQIYAAYEKRCLWAWPAPPSLKWIQYRLKE
jgi:hypothetical protein